MLPILTVILCLVLLLLLTIGVFLYASGLFEHVCCEIKRPPVLCEASTYAYKVHDGPYAEAGYLFTEAYSIDPKCIQCAIKYEKIAESDGPPIPSVVGSLLRTTDPDCREAFAKAGFTITRLEPIEEALVASFPHISFLSIRIGAARVYGNMNAYIQEHNLKVDTFIELYDGEWIHYLGLISDSEKFKLPPSCESSDSSVVVPTDQNETDGPDQSEPVGEHGDCPVETLTSSTELPDYKPCAPAEPPPSNGESDESEADFEKISDASIIPTV
ncbi:hypothetical protein CRM22_007348 [Opisthorchis felineus]|uniref:Uncharacterized protein n=1 Tax=Opisthorchis felineus TaxID=147828 RepID=A0A4S2LG96_OPIFE|nr:hypothetical protein CRM22_007348 [Opisthorchis felineus]